jgi:hypothetical protein
MDEGGHDAGTMAENRKPGPVGWKKLVLKLTECM